MEEEDHYNGCLVNYMAEDFERSREYFVALDPSQISTLAEQTEDPSFFVEASSGRTHEKGWEQP